MQTGRTLLGVGKKLSLDTKNGKLFKTRSDLMDRAKAVHKENLTSLSSIPRSKSLCVDPSATDEVGIGSRE